jgi:hypothetical protein
MRVLRYQENTHSESVEQCLSELVDRFNLADIVIADTIENSKAALMSAPETERAKIAVSIVYDFVTANIYGGEEK